MTDETARRSAGALAASGEAVDPRLREFLESRLGAEAAARVEVRSLAGDASTRRYFRLAEAGLTTVAAVYPEPFADAELSFTLIRQLLAGFGLPVPEVLASDGARGIVLLQDLGDLTLQELLRDKQDGEREELYREAADQVARLQREAERAPHKAPCFQVAFDIEKLSWELHYFEKHFLEGFRGCALSVEDRATLAESFHRLAEEIASWPRVLCHRDFHSRNLMRHEQALYWIDFQDARMGPATYDLASLLRDSYVDLPEDLVVARLEEFRQKAVPGESREVFQRRFELMCIQRNLKALGTFGYMATVRANPVYAQYVPRTLASARRNLARYPELEALRRVLARHLAELA